MHAPRTAVPHDAATILIADDVHTNRRVLEALLVSSGHRVLHAEDGAQAVELFERHAPDVVLLDVMMPNMDGLEACRRIKQRAAPRFAPVLFLTALSEDEALAECIAAGGDDFLTKPFNGAVLRSKLFALQRIRKLHETIRAQSQDLEFHRNLLLHDQEMAQRILARIVEASELAAPNIRHMLASAALFSGDILIATRLPSGAQRVLMGDFTGHGLPAAVGAMPVAELFFELSQKGASLPALLAKLGDRVRAILPDGMFLAACGFDVHPAHGRIVLWNGGLPDALLVRPGHGILRRFASTHLPLGILSSSELTFELAEAQVEPGDQLVAYSDGVIEHHDAAGAMFGQARLEHELSAGALARRGGARRDDGVRNADGGFERLVAALRAHGGADRPHDDITLVEVTCVPFTRPVAAPEGSAASGPFESGWNASFEFNAHALRQANPPLLVLRHLMEFDELRAHREALYLVLAELYTNALDHGLLGLDSEWKRDDGGFERYLRERAARLSSLKHGAIHIGLSCDGGASAHRLRISVEDTGAGFDWRALPPHTPTPDSCFGRGFPLVRAMCESVAWRDPGNRIEVVYRW